MMGSYQRKKSSDIWCTTDVSVLLDLYEDKWISINRGNFKAKHWTEISCDIHAQRGIVFSESQCKNKWENMKKTFMKEKQKESAFGAEPSRWEYFSCREDLLGSTPKVSGLADGFTGDDFVNREVVSLAEDEDIGTEDNVVWVFMENRIHMCMDLVLWQAPSTTTLVIHMTKMLLQVPLLVSLFEGKR
ncbi:hypothetical protein L7F22_008216 [Adiantum nelumboides]|nr:hypothetical protein [Adiantum nelumboides]